MNRKRISILMFGAALLFGARAEAGVYADDLSKCLVKSASVDDHATLIRWMFGALSLHPALQSMTTITPEQRDTYNTQMAALYERLIYGDCHSEAVAGLKYEGTQALIAGFQVFGEVAARDLFSNPLVTQGLSGLAKHFNAAKSSALYKEAGVPEPSTPPAAQ